MLTIQKMKKPKYTNKFVVRMEYMFGDADGEKTIKRAFDEQHKDEAEQLYKLYEEVIAAYGKTTYGRPGVRVAEEKAKELLLSDKYSKIATYLGVDKESLERSGVNEILDWPCDPGSDYTCSGSPQNVKVVYFNNGGVEHSVKVS